MSAVQCTNLCTTSKPPNAILLNSACAFNNTTFANCQEACLDPGYQFSSPKTILGCDRFSWIVDFDQTASHAHLSCNETYANAVLDLLNGCLEQYCEDDNKNDELGGCPTNKVKFSEVMCGNFDSKSPHGVMWSILTMADWRNADVCTSLVRTVNADIGGIGVSHQGQIPVK